MDPRDSIEVHFDESNGRLDLACEAEVFAAHRELARAQIGRVFNLPFDKIREINVIDSEARLSRRESAKRRKLGAGKIVLAVLVLGLAAMGAYALVMRKFG